MIPQLANYGIVRRRLRVTCRGREPGGACGDVRPRAAWSTGLRADLCGSELRA